MTSKVNTAANFQDSLERTRLEPPKTWQDNEAHFTAALSHPWYNIITKLNGLVFLCNK
jgi:hypothetical protein